MSVWYQLYHNNKSLLCILYMGGILGFSLAILWLNYTTNMGIFRRSELLDEACVSTSLITRQLYSAHHSGYHHSSIILTTFNDLHKTFSLLCITIYCTPYPKHAFLWVSVPYPKSVKEMLTCCPGDDLISHEVALSPHSCLAVKLEM